MCVFICVGVFLTFFVVVYFDFYFQHQATAGRIKACADVLNQWYKYEGYLLSEVSNAIISPNGTISWRVFFCPDVRILVSISHPPLAKTDM